jgi:hypothetical protein
VCERGEREAGRERGMERERERERAVETEGRGKLHSDARERRIRRGKASARASERARERPRDVVAADMVERKAPATAAAEDAAAVPAADAGRAGAAGGLTRATRAVTTVRSGPRCGVCGLLADQIVSYSYHNISNPCHIIIMRGLRPIRFAAGNAGRAKPRWQAAAAALRRE